MDNRKSYEMPAFIANHFRLKNFVYTTGVYN